MAATRYRAPPAAALRLEPLDLLVAVYHRRSGATHMVASPVPEILAALEPAPLALDALLLRLADEFHVVDADIDVLAERVEELEAAGLLDRVE